MTTRRSMTLLAAVAAAMFTAPAIAHASPVIGQPFHADSGDNCRYGSTGGTLAWRTTSTTPTRVIAVDVDGKVADRPLPADPGTACRDDRLYSVATFTAYSGNSVVDREAHRADNGTTAIRFTLGGTSATTGIDRVVIQVCRHRSQTLPPSYCGRPAEYRPPTTTAP